jgi:hypothetical protein
MGLSKMLLAMFNAVKVESVPLNFAWFLASKVVQHG